MNLFYLSSYPKKKPANHQRDHYGQLPEADYFDSYTQQLQFCDKLGEPAAGLESHLRLHKD